MKRWIIIGTAIALLAVMAVPAMAQMRMRGDFGRGHYHAVDITRIPELNLTAEQIVKLRSLRDKHLNEIRPFRDQMYRKSMEIKDLWLSQNPDRAKLEVLESELHLLQSGLSEKIAVYNQNCFNLLTDQQRAMLQSLEERTDYGHGRGMMGHGGRGWRGQDRGMYDSVARETFTGEVLGIEKSVARNRLNEGLVAVVRTEKETLSVHLGPAWYLERLDKKILKGDRVEVKGIRTTLAGNPIILAVEIRKGDNVLILRDAAGVPVWAGRGMRR